MRNLAFSLIELLVVVAIVAILSAAAIPSYQSYLVKARVLELLNVAQAYKIKLVEATFDGHSEDQDISLDHATIERVKLRTVVGDPSIYIVEVIARMPNANQPGIGISMHNEPFRIQLQGRETGEILSWSCHVAAAYNEHVPAQCKNNELM